jgi:glycosyltransferase involved in cell wall biosynthesis
MRYFLTQASRWCDRIYVLDNGSTDQTWHIANEVALTHPQVVPYRREMAPFNDALRGDIFNRYKSDAQVGDWWCRLDADEIYIDDPRAFLAAVPHSHHVVWAVHLQYYLTELDLVRFSPDDENAPPPEITSENLPRYYIANYSVAIAHRIGDSQTHPAKAPAVSVPRASSGPTGNTARCRQARRADVRSLVHY